MLLCNWGRVYATHNHLMTNYDTSKRGRVMVGAKGIVRSIWILDGYHGIMTKTLNLLGFIM